MPCILQRLPTCCVHHPFGRQGTANVHTAVSGRSVRPIRCVLQLQYSLCGSKPFTDALLYECIAGLPCNDAVLIYREIIVRYSMLSLLVSYVLECSTGAGVHEHYKVIVQFIARFEAAGGLVPAEAVAASTVLGHSV